MLRLSSLVCLTVLAACSSGTSSTAPASPPPTGATVNATPNISFDPSPLHIVAGGTVTFAFGSVAHNVFFDAIPGAPADIPGTNANTSATRTFLTAGTYVYNCHIHPGMTGTIIVSQVPAASDSGYSGYTGY
jgi:plastocyanin